MAPVGYDVSSIGLTQIKLLFDNNGIGPVEMINDGSIFRFLLSTGRVVAVVENSFLEISGIFAGEGNRIMHASFLLSGATHSGHQSLREWPDRWFEAPSKLIELHTIYSALGADVVSVVNRAAVLSLCGSIVLSGVYLSKEGRLGTFICPQFGSPLPKAPNGNWNDFSAILTQIGFCECSLRRREWYDPAR